MKKSTLEAIVLAFMIFFCTSVNVSAEERKAQTGICAEVQKCTDAAVCCATHSCPDSTDCSNTNWFRRLILKNLTFESGVSRSNNVLDTTGPDANSFTKKYANTYSLDLQYKASVEKILAAIDSNVKPNKMLSIFEVNLTGSYGNTFTRTIDGNDIGIKREVGFGFVAKAKMSVCLDGLFHGNYDPDYCK